jgi:predicted P-loop ATPase
VSERTVHEYRAHLESLSKVGEPERVEPVYDFIVGKNGGLKPVLQNAMLFFASDVDWQGVLGFNEFTWRVVTRKPAPWLQSVANANWTDSDDSYATAWLQRNGLLVASHITAEAVQAIAKQHPFHPVRDYLTSLHWDETSRIDSWVIDYLGAADDVFTRAAGARWLISAVARIMQPGCQADHTLLLEGEQGIRKSSALRALASDRWFTDHLSDLGAKDSRMELLGRWIIELSELDRVRRGELERVKGFLTARKDSFRPPYGRRVQDVPRQCVFAATTNDQSSLVDESGNRRFWPVLCGAIRVEELASDRDQIWAEAFQRYRAGEHWWIDNDDLAQAAQSAQEERYTPGPWDEVIIPWLEEPVQRSAPDGEHGTFLPITPFDSDKTRTTITDVLQHAVGKSIDRCTQTDKNTVVRCLVHLRWKRAQDGKREHRGKWFYWRPGMKPL